MVTLALAAICMFCFIFIPSSYFVLDPTYFPGAFWWITSITYQFFHANKEHIFGNLCFGFPWLIYLEFWLKERARKICDVWIWGGVFGGALQSLLVHSALIGASISLSAIAGYSAFRPGKRTQLRAFLQCYVVGDMLSNLFSALTSHAHIGFWGHLGGYAYGVLAALLSARKQSSPIAKPNSSGGPLSAFGHTFVPQHGSPERSKNNGSL